MIRLQESHLRADFGAESGGIPSRSVAFLLDLGRALHRFGSPAHQLEDTLQLAAQRLGIEAQFFYSPTAFLATFGPPENQRTALVRFEPGSEVDLGKLQHLDELTQQVLAGELSIAEARQTMADILSRPSRYPAWASWLCFGLISGAAARFFGGGPGEILVGACGGWLTGFLAQALGRFPGTGQVFELVSAFLAALLAGMATFVLPIASFEATVAALIILVPGFTLTVAMTEIATRHLVSGTTRLTSAAIVFLEIIFGVALGQRLAGHFGAVSLERTAWPLPAWTEALAFLLTAGAFSVLFQVPLRKLPWVILACALSFGGARIGGAFLSPETGVFLGAFLVGAGANAVARWRNQPAALMLVPGTLLLVPGSLGVRSLSMMLEKDPLSGVDSAFSMALLAISIVAGLLVANAVVAPRRRHSPVGTSGFLE
ncbi:MAG: threonine/serine exporter family protein [Planctomycetota bacterium]|nr:MAG: threonine/serine exporter family protein [Planctomycetota bacterium]